MMSLSTTHRMLSRFITCVPAVVTSNTLRQYSRWTHRRPAKVILPFEPTDTALKKEKVIDLRAEQTSKEVDNTSKVKKVEESKPKPQHAPQIVKEKKDFSHVKQKNVAKVQQMHIALNHAQVFDENNEVIYEKCKDNDGRISTLLMKLKSKKDRLKCGQVLVEGWRLIVDGLEAKCKLNYIVFSRREDLMNIRPFLPKTGVKIYKIPYKEIEMWSSVETSPGIFGVFALPTVDNIKRFTKPFPMQIICDNIRVPGNLGAIMRAATGAGCERILLTKGCVDVWDPKVVRSAAGAHFRLPVHTGIEWEKMSEFVPKDNSVFIADSNSVVRDDQAIPTGSLADMMSVIPYYSIEYNMFKYTTIIVGGETEGISEESYRFAADRNGLRVNIPLQKGVDSLNTGMATAVILFEIKKQLVQSGLRAKLERENMFGT